MSYAILYNSVCIKVKDHYLLCALMGDNNVWERNFKSERRVRNWGTMGPGLMTYQQAQEWLAHMLKYDTNEYWKSNGKWVDKEMLKRWLNNSLKRAVDLETFLAANGLYDITVWAHEKDRPFGRDCDKREYIRTNEEFALWAKKVSKENKIVDAKIDREDVFMPKVFDDDTPVIIKHENGYVTRVEENRITSSVYLKDALIFTYKEAMLQKKENRILSGSTFRIAAVPKALESKTAYLIKLPNGAYVYKITRGRLRYTASEGFAHRYHSKAAVHNAIKLICEKFSAYKEKQHEFEIQEVAL